MASLERAYFERLYAEDSDPWDFATSWYERRKYALTMAALPEERYRSGFEPGCSIGVLSALLARRCDRLLCTDIIDRALEQAAARLSGESHAVVEHRPIPEAWPTGPFDLVVLSEIAYYFDAATLEALVTRLVASLAPGATLVAVHWRGPTNYPLRAEEAHAILAAGEGLDHLVHHVEAPFVLDVWREAAAGGR